MAFARRWQSLPSFPAARSHPKLARDIRRQEGWEGGNDA